MSNNSTYVFENTQQDQLFHDLQDQDQESNLSSVMPLLYTLGIGSFVASAFYFFMRNFWNEIKKNTISSITIDNDDPIFDSLTEYLSAKGYIKRKMNSLHARLDRSRKSSMSDYKEGDEDNPHIKYKPSSGMHSFVINGKRIFFYQSDGETITVGWHRSPKTLQKINLWCFGNKNLSKLKQVLNLSLEYGQNKNHEKTTIYAKHEWWWGWDEVQIKEPRNFESVVLDTDLAQNICDDVQSFLDNKKWYLDRGVPYRRGYLLWGPPGTGKTSYIQALAGKMKLNICTVNLAGNQLDDDSLNKLLENIPLRSIILMEDIDAIFVQRSTVQQRKGNYVTFSGLLNALDGVRSQEGTILFMTTNHKEKLDPALLRPGRADRHFELNYASQSQIEKLFLKFYPEEKKLAREFSKKVPELQFSMAKLQGHFLKFKGNPQLTLDKYETLFENDQFVKEMCIIEWLIRLGCEQYVRGFIEQGIQTVQNLAGVEEGDLEKMGVKTQGAKKRIMAIAKGDNTQLEKFKYMSANGVRGFFEVQVPSEDFAEKLTKIVPEKSVTEFQLREIFENFDNLCEEKLMKKIELLVRRNQALKDKPQLKLQYAQKQVENCGKKFKYDVKRVFQQGNLKKYIETFEEQDLLSCDVLLTVDEKMMEKDLKIEKFCDRKYLEEQIGKLKEEKEKFIKEQQAITLETFVFEEENQLRQRDQSC